VEDDKEMKWEVLRNIDLASSQNGMRNSQLAHVTQDESWCVSLQFAWVSNRPAICTKSVRCCVFVYRDQSRCTTSKIS